MPNEITLLDAISSRTVKKLIENGMPDHLAQRAYESWIGLLAQPNMVELLEAMPVSAAAFTQYCFMQGYCAGSNHPKK